MQVNADPGLHSAVAYLDLDSLETVKRIFKQVLTRDILSFGSLLSSCLGCSLQFLSARLGVYSGRYLAGHCGVMSERLPFLVQDSSRCDDC